MTKMMTEEEMKESRLQNLEKQVKALWSEVSAHIKRLDSQLEMISSSKDTIYLLRKRIAELERKHE